MNFIFLVLVFLAFHTIVNAFGNWKGHQREEGRGRLDAALRSTAAAATDGCYAKDAVITIEASNSLLKVRDTRHE